MPAGYEALLKEILKCNICIDKNQMDRLIKESKIKTESPLEVVKGKYYLLEKKETRHKGIPQGGIISPLLMNWTLDGLYDNIRDNAYVIDKSYGKGEPKQTFLDKSKLEKFRSLYPDKTREELLQDKKLEVYKQSQTSISIFFYRFADDFIAGTNNEESMNNIKKGIASFLAERGLELSEEKTKTFK